MEDKKKHDNDESEEDDYLPQRKNNKEYNHENKYQKSKGVVILEVDLDGLKGERGAHGAPGPHGQRGPAGYDVFIKNYANYICI